MTKLTEQTLDQLSADIKYQEIADLVEKIVHAKEPGVSPVLPAGWASADLFWRASRNAFDLAENLSKDDKERRKEEVERAYS